MFEIEGREIATTSLEDEPHYVTTCKVHSGVQKLVSPSYLAFITIVWFIFFPCLYINLSLLAGSNLKVLSVISTSEEPSS